VSRSCTGVTDLAYDGMVRWVPSLCLLMACTYTPRGGDPDAVRVSFELPGSSVPEAMPSVIVVTLDRPSEVDVPVAFELGGTALPGYDYTLASGALVFAPGITRLELDLDVLDNEIDEDDRTVIVSLTDPLNAVLGEVATHTYTIVDDDAPPTVAFETDAATVFRDAGTIEIPITLSLRSGKPITVAFSINQAMTDAAANTDFVLMTSSPLQLAPGDTTATIRIAIVEGAAPDRTLVLDLASPVNATPAEPARHFLTISNVGFCLGEGAYRACVPPPSAAVSIPAGLLDTDTSALCADDQPADWLTAGQPASCFVIATQITSSGNGAIVVTGSRPLVLFATTSINLSNNLDAASHRGGSAGPGASPREPQCAPAQNGRNSSGSGGGGGAGASFLSRGGNGGSGGTGQTLVAGGVGAAASPPPTRLQGGCKGGNGGRGEAQGNNAGAGGQGGGAVYLVAGTTIDLRGRVINVSGAGAAAKKQVADSAGGGGGGSGGMIKLHAPTITTNASTRLIAHGGGGSSGASDAKVAGDGDDPDPATLDQAAGGSGGGGNGGKGFARAPATAGGNGGNNKGGGGGGGGGGFVQSNQPFGAAVVGAGRKEPM
jgi:hypothetical protein